MHFPRYLEDSEEGDCSPDFERRGEGFPLEFQSSVGLVPTTGCVQAHHLEVGCEVVAQNL